MGWLVNVSIRHEKFTRLIFVCLVLSLAICLCSCVIINNYHNLGGSPSEQTPADPIEQPPSDDTSKDDTSKDDTSVDAANEPTEPTNLPSPEDVDSAEGVWVTAGGTKYHSDPSCSNMKAPVQMTEHDAQLQGYTPCKRCN